MNRTILLRISAMVAAALAPLAAAGQVNPDVGTSSAPNEVAYKYEAYVGVAYSRIRQVPASYSGLLGGKASLTRDWGKYFGLTGSQITTGWAPATAEFRIPATPPSTPSSLARTPCQHSGNLSGQVFAELAQSEYLSYLGVSV